MGRKWHCAVRKGTKVIVNNGRPMTWTAGDPEIIEKEKLWINKLAGEAFESIKKPRPAKLYHYTDGPGLVGIVTSQRMRASHVAYLNDITEVRRSIGALRDYLLMRQGHEQDSGLKAFLGLCADILRPPLSDPAQLAQIWVTCFSTQENQLSQWRAYGGYCLEFDSSKLTEAAEQEHCALMPCDYDEFSHTTLIHSVSQKLIEIFVAGRGEYPADKHEIYGRALFSFMMEQMAWIAPLMKHAAFREESEWRIYRRRVDGDTSGIEFVSRNSMITGHITFDLRRPAGIGITLLPISRVLVGPGRHVSLSRAAIAAMLAQQGYADVPVWIATYPFARIEGRN